MSPTGKRSDPYSAYRFKVEIEGIIAAGFTDVSGLTIETEVETIKEGGVNNYEYKLPKFTKYSNITLKR
ncbi:MAG: phage tail protein, partial [Methanosarcinales archaeon]|nr:phage tail protein [Methanosarcinales archaeon]